MLRHPFNLGVGGAIRTGLRYAAERGFDRVVQIDADGQHVPSEAARLLAELDAQHADLVIGSPPAAVAGRIGSWVMRPPGSGRRPG